MDRYDVAVIGSGIVGLFISYMLGNLHHDGRLRARVLCIDKECAVALHASGRNSGVIHSGIHAKPGTLKARFCVKGNRMMYQLLDRLSIPYRRSGMLILCTNDGGAGALEELQRRGHANGVDGVRVVQGDEVGRIERYARGDLGLWVGSAGVTDATMLAYTLYERARASGVEFMLNSTVTGIDEVVDGYRVEMVNSRQRESRRTVHARLIVNSAGVHADDIANMVGLRRYRIYPCIGEYYLVRRKPHLVNSLIYPIPTFDHRGLGIHLTKRLDGTIAIGPNAIYVESKDEESDGVKGRLNRSMDEFYSSAANMVDGINREDLEYGYYGIRARLAGYGSSEEPDFVVEEHPSNLIHLIGIESPGFTASPAIAEHVIGMIGDRL
ncbi:MAG: NAD(P)/FAD-dependent oxidoreductase [Candidatus Nitrosocaldus sp.]|nr:NAD(P)/FAD-dependent oxidoreductase [Candidatus Nitrosocaldus sp.]MDW8275866.1 NAD(P)/FAD-dependent oxidoreductase [Candidatus Nitrosocaldus sp.]